MVFVHKASLSLASRQRLCATSRLPSDSLRVWTQNDPKAPINPYTLDYLRHTRLATTCQTATNHLTLLIVLHFLLQREREEHCSAAGQRNPTSKTQSWTLLLPHCCRGYQGYLCDVRLFGGKSKLYPQFPSFPSSPFQRNMPIEGMKGLHPLLLMFPLGIPILFTKQEGLNPKMHQWQQLHVYHHFTWFFHQPNINQPPLMLLSGEREGYVS